MTPDSRCPRCGAPLAPAQGWCTDCGLAVRTTLSPAPRSWRPALGLAGALVALALAGLVASFVIATEDDGALTAATTATTAEGPSVRERAQRLRRCVGSTGADVAPFGPTAELARRQGGDAFGATVGGEPVMLLVYPTPAAAQVGFQDASHRLVELEQQDPKAFAEMADTKTQVVGSVLEIHPGGALPAAAAAKVSGCIAAG